MSTQTIAIIGADHGSEAFLEQMLDLRNQGVEVLAVFRLKGIAVNALAETHGIKQLNLQEIVDLGERLDIIFDLSNDRQLRMELRKTLFSSDNKHSIIAPASMTRLMWTMMGKSITRRSAVGY